MSSNGRGRLLVGKKDILDYLQIGEPMFYEFVHKMGMPARVINNRWYAHTENIDDFMKTITRTDNRKSPIQTTAE